MARKLTPAQYRAVMTAERKTGRIHESVRPNTVASLVRLGLAGTDGALSRDGVALADRWHAPADRERAAAEHREMVERGTEVLRQEDGAEVAQWRIQSTVRLSGEGTFSLAEGRPVGMVASDRMVTLSARSVVVAEAAASVGGALRVGARAVRSEGGRSVRVEWEDGSYWTVVALGADGEPLRPVASVGMVACGCCSRDIVGRPGDRCEGCRYGDGGNGPGDGCDFSTSWHCFTGHCDGSGCSYEGECEGAPAPGDAERLCGCGAVGDHDASHEG